MRYRLVEDSGNQASVLGDSFTELDLKNMRVLIAKGLTVEQARDLESALQELKSPIIVLPADTDISSTTLEPIEPDDGGKFPIPYVWSPDQSLEAQKNGAYWERNMLALMLAETINSYFHAQGLDENYCGWYLHQGEGFEGWSRVISLNGGQITFHVPDDFDLGYLPRIEPNWDGHSTAEKWRQVMEYCGCKGVRLDEIQSGG